MLKNLEYIGLNLQSVNYISSFLNNRKQYVENNGNSSEILLIGNHSIFQGSSLSCLFYNIFTLDLPFINHNEVHLSHYENYLCKQPFICTYIDDCYGVIEGNDENIWMKIAEYIEKIKNTTMLINLKLMSRKPKS